MENKSVNIVVYGAEVKCASCVNAPGSKETYEWIQAAIARKFKGEFIQYNYYDINQESQEGADQEIVQQILEDEWFYPLVLVEGKVVAEGNPRLKTIYKALDDHGVPRQEEQ